MTLKASSIVAEYNNIQDGYTRIIHIIEQNIEVCGIQI